MYSYVASYVLSKNSVSWLFAITEVTKTHGPLVFPITSAVAKMFFIADPHAKIGGS